MIIGAGVTEAIRRETVRQLANMSTNLYNDTRLDEKILNADAIATIMWPGNIVPTDDTYLRVFMTVSNIEAAIQILSGIDGDMERQMVRDYRTRCKDIMMAVTDRAPEQNAEVVRSESSSQQGTFN